MTPKHIEEAAERYIQENSRLSFGQAFIAGYNLALSSPSGQGGIWVRASERLPTEVSWKIVRNVPGDMGSIGVYWFHDGHWYDDFGDERICIDKGILPDAEWLDETPSPALDSSRLRSALEKLLYEINNLDAIGRILLDVPEDPNVCNDLIDIITEARSALTDTSSNTGENDRNNGQTPSQDNDGWVEIKEGCEMPEDSSNVLIYDGETLEVDYWYANKWTYFPEATHWKRISPPKNTKP